MNGIYIHLPFCLKKCAYCDFASYSDAYSLSESYIDAVISEMSQYKGEKADTVYLGGGTPTSLPQNLLLKLISSVYDYFNVSADCEITVETNPKTADIDYLVGLKKIGVNRLSIGVQSMIDSELAFLGRIHSAEDAKNAICCAKEAGFDNINVDLMFGLACQTYDSVKKSLNELIALSPTHFSCYSLIIEENTVFGRLSKSGHEFQMEEDAERRLYSDITNILSAFGYEQYEISNFAKPGFRSRHNIKYWKREPYIGLGAAAHSFFENKRYGNSENINEYINFIKSGKERIKEEICLTDAISEFIFLGLRMTDGISLSEFKACFGHDIWDIYGKEINELISLGMLTMSNDCLRLTPKGVDVSNEVFVRFI